MRLALCRGVDLVRGRLFYGWSLAAISVGFSLRSFEHGLLAPVTGSLVDRLGARRMALRLRRCLRYCMGESPRRSLSVHAARVDEPTKLGESVAQAL